MMISPEGYYEVSLKGKAQAEILKEIRSLKREINQLKRYMEEHSLEPEEMFPTRLTRLKCNREYLDRAIQAYAEAGGIYKPTKAEQKDLRKYFKRQCAPLLAPQIVTVTSIGSIVWNPSVTLNVTLSKLSFLFLNCLSVRPMLVVPAFVLAASAVLPSDSWKAGIRSVRPETAL